MIDPKQPLASARIVVFDTETTGLTPGHSKVIEIGALALEDGRETGRFESLIDPGVPIPAELVAVHGIDDEMVRGQPRFPEVARLFLEFARDSVLAAHNAPYDIAMLFTPLVEAGLSPPGNPVIDTCRLARRTLDAPNYQLATLARTLEIPLEGHHRAMPDVEACTALLRVCLDRLGDGVTLADVERRSATRLAFDIQPAGGLREYLPDNLLPIREAMGSRRRVEIIYKGGSHGDTPRLITPLFLMELDGFPCVSALCHIDWTLKNFRVAQIARAGTV
jgi:DNA polymerase-3 subunit epsilon